MKKSVKLISVILSVIMAVSSFMLPATAFAQSTTSKGIDVSEHNKNVDFYALKNAGYDFVMLRLGYSDKYIDKDFYNNVVAASNAGLKIGVYLYSYAYNTAEAQAEANFVINTLASLNASYKQNITLPVAYDLEDKKITNEGGCGKTEITSNALTFCNALKSAGYDTMVYANDTWFKKYIDVYQLYNNGIKIWYANWTNDQNSNLNYITDTTIPCYMWQYQSGSDANAPFGLDQNILYINIDVTLSFNKVNYDGYGKFPTATVFSGQVQLINGVDYSVAYYNNVNAGTASVVVTGIGAYAHIGNITKNFTINPILYNSSNASIKLSKTKYSYDGKLKRPAVTVYDSASNVIPSEYYTVNYLGNASPGKKKVTVTFKGNYSGSLYKTYTIIPKKQSVTSIKSPSYKKIKVYWKKDKTVSGYQVQYSTSSKFNKDRKALTVSKKYRYKTIKTSKSNRKYYVRVRAYKVIDGKKVYGSWSKAKSVKVR